MPGLIFPGTYYGSWCEGMGDYLYAQSQWYEADCKECKTHLSNEADKYEMEKGGVLCLACWRALIAKVGYVSASLDY